MPCLRPDPPVLPTSNSTMPTFMGPLPQTSHACFYWVSKSLPQNPSATSFSFHILPHASEMDLLILDINSLTQERFVHRNKQSFKNQKVHLMTNGYGFKFVGHLHRPGGLAHWKSVMIASGLKMFKSRAADGGSICYL